MTTLTLREWSITEAVALTAPQVDALRSVFKATVQPTLGRDEGFDVATSGTVGAAQVGDITVVVTPKVPISRVMFLLGYAADPSFRPEDADLGALPDIVSGVTRLFTTLTERALNRGVLRGYRTIETEMHTVRGRIDLAQQLRRRPGLELPLAVRFQEHDDDILENQLLLNAANLLRRAGTRDTTARNMLHRIGSLLQDVTVIHFPPSAVPAVEWTRLNQHLRPAVELARLLLQFQSPDVLAGATRTPGLTIDMAAIFETFVRAAMREALDADEQSFPTGSKCPPLWLDRQQHIALEPDLSYWSGSTCTFIGDVKYKRNSGSGHNDDLYQLFAYATAAALPQATLIYADGPPTPRTHTVPGVDIQLHVEHLDLNVQPDAVLSQIDRLAVRIPTHRSRLRTPYERQPLSRARL
jgi:5-methylcytosine-specific restriction enzyme subunit McrC